MVLSFTISLSILKQNRQYRNGKNDILIILKYTQYEFYEIINGINNNDKWGELNGYRKKNLIMC